jgi:hypothetical protein
MWTLRMTSSHSLKQVSIIKFETCKKILFLLFLIKTNIALYFTSSILFILGILFITHIIYKIRYKIKMSRSGFLSVGILSIKIYNEYNIYVL